MLLGLYRGLGRLAPPVARLVLLRRRARGKEHPERYRERMGNPRRNRPDGALIWLHAASVGEALSALPIGRLLARLPSAHVMVTSGTVTSAKLMDERLPEGAFHQFVPVDCPAWVGRFLDHYRPDLALWVESELWPALLAGTVQRGTPAILLNGRMSARSLRRWRRFPGAARRLIRSFDAVLAQSEADAGRFRRLGARRVETPGNLKMAAAPLPADPAALASLADAVRGRPVWLAASTHPGEEDAAAEAHRSVRRQSGDALLVIVPRHPERGPAIANALRRAGHAVGLRSAGDAPDAEADIYIADTLGELGLFYRAAPVAFVGGSLAPHGGQNPIEPAQLGCAILHGPHVGNFSDIAEALQAAGASETVASSDALAAAVGRLLADPAECRDRADRAAVAVEDSAGILDRAMALLEPWLAALPDSATGGASAAASGAGSPAGPARPDAA
ncbi:MAG: 3-deoxy-D-manno-octulosonic acid transferase [Rhodospirillaceae bacterium]|nr:3-deoxy-D-manno-octulosonic acid transferase [Rhodospirillaceae bacterium]